MVRGGTSLLVVAAGVAGCGRPRPGAPADGTPRSPEDASVVATASPDAAVQPPSACRALLSVAVVPASPCEATWTDCPAYAVADVRLDGAVTVERADGLVGRAGGELFAIDIVRHEARRRRWDEVLVVPVARPTDAVVVLSTAPTPDSSADGECEGGCAEAEVLDVTSVVGPYLSFHVDHEGYFGGLHGDDLSYYTTVELPTGRPATWGAIAGSGVVRAARAELARVNRARRKEELDELELDFDWKGEDTALAWTAGEDAGARPFGPYVRLRVACCTWAENHNLFDLAAPLAPETPVVAEAVRLDPAHPGLFLAPDGCGAVGVRDGKLMVWRRGADALETFAWSGPALRGALGVTWLEPGAAFAMPDLALARDNEREARRLLASGRKHAGKKDYDRAIADLEQAAARAPGNASVLSELGWTQLLAGRLDDAQATSEKALAAARTDRQRAAILYNLGRIAEARGDVATARGRYEESLRLRRNKVVKKQLDALPK